MTRPAGCGCPPQPAFFLKQAITEAIHMHDFPVPAHDLLPHAAPMLCIERLLRASETEAEAETVLFPGHLLLHDGRLTEAGFVEIAAQAAGAMKGYWETRRGLPPRKGFLAAAQDFVFPGEAEAGDILLVAVAVVAEVAGISLIEASISREGPDGSREVLAQGKLKVFTFDKPLSA